VLCYEQEGEAYLLQLSALLQDDSRLEMRDYLFADGGRKYAYQWMEADGTLRRRWDNAPHWLSVATAVMRKYDRLPICGREEHCAIVEPAI
jgi:hypothetical protein